MSYGHMVRGLVLVAGLLVVLRFGVRSGDYDIVAMIRTIHQTTTEIGDVNASILTSLGTFGQQFEQVDTVQARLATMEGLVNEQIGELERLAVQTGHQAELSLEMQRLTGKMVSPVDGLAQTAVKEAELLGVMSERTADLALSLRVITAINRTIAEKLQRAEELSALVLSSMP